MSPTERLCALALAWLAALSACASNDDSDHPSSGSGGTPSGPTTGAGAGATGGGGGNGGAGGAGGRGGPSVKLPKTSITPAEVAVLVNDADPQSVAVGAYYADKRAIPAANVIHVDIAADSDNIAAADFATLKSTLDASVPASIQAYAVSWTRPSRVDCMSLTTALALGFDTKFCNTSGTGCGVTAPSPYFDSDSFTPFTDQALRPAMILAGVDEASAKALVDRGVAADDTFPAGDGYLVRTTDVARSVRWPVFMQTVTDWSYPEGLHLTYVDNAAGGGLDYIENTDKVLFYFTGLASVPSIDTNTYLPGAIADHLTSYGGQIPTSGQMSIIEWLNAGATASYGTMQEPCNFTQKFPRTDIVLPHYFRGETLLEAYWKSVEWPGEGVFVGEPLARPWGKSTVSFAGGALDIKTTLLDPTKTYEIDAADDAAGPFTPVLQGIQAPKHELYEIVVPDATAPFYELKVSGS